MKKRTKLILIVIAVMASLWFIGQATNILRRLSSPAIANYPTIRAHEGFFTSNLVSPSRFDFICYYATTPQYGRHVRMFRLVGMPGDKIEIRKGQLFVNDQDADKDLSLAHNYVLPLSEWERIKTMENIDTTGINAYGDSLTTYVSDKLVATHAIKGRRQILAKEQINEAIQKQFGQPWNEDNFGPIIVPPGKYFALGDNRSYAEDSRYTGFIDKSDYVATVLGR
jgi:signal peptidase I